MPTMNDVLLILLVGFLLWVMWTLLQPWYVFFVRIKEGRPLVQKGKLSVNFLAAITEVCQEGQIHRGWLGGVQRNRRISLVFSRDFSPRQQQRLRNEWNLHGL